MLAELRDRMNAEERWQNDNPEALQSFRDARALLDNFLDYGTIHKASLLKTIIYFGEADRTEREIDVEVDGEKFHLLVYSNSIKHREHEIRVALLTDDRSLESQIIIPIDIDFVLGKSYDTGGRILQDVELLQKDVLPIIENEVKKDTEENPGLLIHEL